jgi:hypothetical protein
MSTEYIPIIFTVAELTAITEQVVRDIRYWDAADRSKLAPWIRLLTKIQSAWAAHHQVKTNG